MTETAKPKISLAGSDAARRFGQYHAGVPLNEELKDIREGKLGFAETVPVAGPAPHPTTAAAARKLTRGDRTLLREIRAHEGWPVLMRLFGNKLAGLREQAISKSQDNPLRNRDEIAEGWEIFKLAERIVGSIEGDVERELGELVKQEEQGQ